MAATTITVQQILMKIADDAMEYQSAFVRSVTSQTVLVLGGVSIGERETFKYALATVNGGGIRQVTAYDESAETVTLASGFDVTVAAGNVVKLAWWDPKKRDAAMSAINEAVRQSWGKFGRETKGSLSITLDAADAEYDLPAGVGKLWRVGILQDSGEYDWRAERDLWRMGGEYGAYTIQFLNNGAAFLPSSWDGETLYGWYLDKEPEVDAESDTTRLPMDWFNLASYLYLLKIGAPLGADGQIDARAFAQWQAKLGQLKADADSAADRLEVGRPKPPVRVRYEKVR